MPEQLRKSLRDRIPDLRRISRVPRQLVGVSPFEGSIRPTRVPLLSIGSGRPTLPFPHPWNYGQPLRILETFFWNADAEQGPGRHNRYLEVPGFAPVLVTRDPRVIRAISAETGDRAGWFDRDTLPSSGIARATGTDTLLYANGPSWKHQKSCQPRRLRGRHSSSPSSFTSSSRRVGAPSASVSNLSGDGSSRQASRFASSSNRRSRPSCWKCS